MDDKQQLLQRYRRVALWGGAALGGVAAFGVSGSSFLYALATAPVVGAVIGYFFFELVIARLIVGPGGSSGSWGGGAASGADGGIDAGGGGGDGGGGGK